MEDEDVIFYYNSRGARERVLDEMNNDFGWNLPKSFMKENAVFLLITAMAHNFCRYLTAIPLMALFGIKTCFKNKEICFQFHLGSCQMDKDGKNTCDQVL